MNKETTTTTQPSELARKIAEELAHDPITFELSEERFCSHVATLIDQHIAELLREEKRLDYLLSIIDPVDMYIGDECVTDHADLMQWDAEGGESDAPEIKKAARRAIDAAMAKEAK